MSLTCSQSAEGPMLSWSFGMMQVPTNQLVTVSSKLVYTAYAYLVKKG